jgi:hypothetical protein
VKLGWLGVVAACSGDGGSSTDAAVADARSADACAGSRTVFLNRAGGAYVRGPEDPVTNSSSILDMNRTVPALTATDPDWSAVVTCVTSKLAMFGVTVTEMDPSPARHIEVVVVNSGTQIGFPGFTNAAAATPCAGNFASAADNTIAFSAWLGDNFNRCWDVSQVVGYTLGLDNVLPCEDLMSVNPTGCSIAAKAFTAVDSPCGDATARNCRCGGSATQNAAARIAMNLAASCP